MEENSKLFLIRLEDGFSIFCLTDFAFVYAAIFRIAIECFFWLNFAFVNAFFFGSSVVFVRRL